MMAYDAFVANEPQNFLIFARKGFTERQIRKDVNKLMKATVRKPLGIQLLPSCQWETYTVSEYAERLLETSGYCEIYVGKRMAEKINALIIEKGGDTCEFGSLQMTVTHRMFGNRTPIERLKAVATESWITVQRRMGRVPSQCEHCGAEPLEIENDFTCMNCDGDVTIEAKRPKSERGMLQEVFNYEEGEFSEPIIKRDSQ
jgi:hypothetical protein